MHFCSISNGCAITVKFCIQVSIPSGLVSDFLWKKTATQIVVIFPERVKQEKKNLVGTRNIARKLLENAQIEIGLFLKCVDCYVNKTVDACFVCTKPHLVLWAQFDVYPYWPVKVLSVDDAASTLEVYFFNDYTSATVSYDNCYLYCDRDPNDYITDQYKNDVKMAIKVRIIHKPKHAKIWRIKLYWM